MTALNIAEPHFKRDWKRKTHITMATHLRTLQTPCKWSTDRSQTSLSVAANRATAKVLA